MDAPVVPPPERLGFRVRLRTRWSDEDNQSVLNNAVYLTLLEETRLAYFRGLGLMLEGNHFAFVLAQTNVRFVRPGRGGAEVEVEAATVYLGRSSFLQAYRVREAESGEVWCEAEALLVGWDNDRRAKSTLAPAFREKIAAFEGMPAGPA